MFDFAWTEIALIGGVALILIGPKDMPVAIKAVTNVVKKARRMAAEFQTHVDDMVRDADLHEVRDGIRQIRSMDIRGTIARAVDSDGSLRRTMTEDPFKEPVRPPPPTVTTPVEALPEHTIAAPPPDPGPNLAPAPVAVLTADAAPAFIPPAVAHRPAPPAFIPPGAANPGAPP